MMFLTRMKLSKWVEEKYTWYITDDPREDEQLI